MATPASSSAPPEGQLRPVDHSVVPALELLDGERSGTVSNMTSLPCQLSVTVTEYLRARTYKEERFIRAHGSGGFPVALATWWRKLITSWWRGAEREGRADAECSLGPPTTQLPSTREHAGRGRGAFNSWTLGSRLQLGSV